jgi:hypothetical protein
MNGPMLKATGLWQKSSVKGGQYLTGRLGGVKVLILENRDRQTDDDPSHHLFFAEAPDRRQDAQQRAQERSDGQRAAGTPRAPQTASGGHRRAAYGHGQRVPDHQAPLDYDNMPEAPEWAR